MKTSAVILLGVPVAGLLLAAMPLQKYQTAQIARGKYLVGVLLLASSMAAACGTATSPVAPSLTTSVTGAQDTGTGGGGGGNTSAYGTNRPGANGGSGVVIIKIPSANSATFSSGVTQSSTTSGGYKIYTVTATSTTSETVRFS